MFTEIRLYPRGEFFSYPGESKFIKPSCLQFRTSTNVSRQKMENQGQIRNPKSTYKNQPCMMWLSGWSIGLQTKRLLILFPLRTYAQLAIQVKPSVGNLGQATNYTLIFHCLPSPVLEINKTNVHLQELTLPTWKYFKYWIKN